MYMYYKIYMDCIEFKIVKFLKIKCCDVIVFKLNVVCGIYLQLCFLDNMILINQYEMINVQEFNYCFYICIVVDKYVIKKENY